MTPNEHALEAERCLREADLLPQDDHTWEDDLKLATAHALVALALQQTGWTTSE
jgi:hypothetical protein